MIILYISNRQIRIIDGSRSGAKAIIKNVYQEVDENGCVLNGVLTDPDTFKQLIQNIWEKHQLSKKKVHLVIDSNQMNIKVMDVPQQKPKQMMEFVGREFGDMDRIEDPVYSYYTLTRPKNKFVKVLATVASREFINNYLHIFEELGITISGFNSALGMAIRVCSHRDVLKEQTCILQFADEMTLINLLFDKGEYIYSSRTRVFSEPDTPEYAVEAVRSISNTLQFAQAEKLPNTISNVYISGLSEELWEVYHDGLSQVNDNLNVEQLQSGKEIVIDSALDRVKAENIIAIAVGGFFEENDKFNLLFQAQIDPEKEKKKEELKKAIIPIAVLAVCVLGITGIAAGRYWTLNKKLQEVKQYTEDATNILLCQEYDNLYQVLQGCQSYINNLTSLEECVNHYPMADSKVSLQVKNCAKGLVSITLNGYDSQTGVLNFTTTASEVDTIHQFILELNRQDIFASVDYSGYSQSQDGEWSVNVSCTMAARQEEEHADDNN